MRLVCDTEANRHSESLPSLHNWKAYAALVRSLELCLDPDQEKLDDEHWDEYPLRDIAEKICLMFICQLIARFDTEKLLKSKFIEKWLAKQNWGSTEVERQMNFMKYIQHKCNRISEIVHKIQGTRSGREALVKAGLMPPGCEEAEDDGPLTKDRFSLFISLNVGDDEGEIDAHAEQVPDENRLRRNRAAMVFNDGSHPLNPNDIIQREPESPH
jgi:hypothetical protein